MMLANGGELNGERLLSPRLVELMGSVFAPDTLPGRPRGESYGLSVRVVNDPVARNSFLSEGSFGWSGAYGTHFWVDRKEKLDRRGDDPDVEPGVPARLREHGHAGRGRRRRAPQREHELNRT